MGITVNRTELSQGQSDDIQRIGFAFLTEGYDNHLQHERMFALLMGDFDRIRYELYPGILILVGEGTDWELPLDHHLATNLHLLMAALMTHNTELASRICDQAARMNEARNV